MSANNKEQGFSSVIIRFGVIAGALVSILGLVFLVFPWLKPVVPEAPPKKVILRDLQVRHEGEVDGDCYHRVVIYFKAYIEGYKDMSLPIYWYLENADTKIPYTYNIAGCGPAIGSNAPMRERRVGEESPLRGNPGSPTSGFKPTTQGQSFPGEIWVDTEYRGGIWRIRLEVTDPEGKLVGSADTEPFPIPQ